MRKHLSAKTSRHLSVMFMLKNPPCRRKACRVAKAWVNQNNPEDFINLITNIIYIFLYIFKKQIICIFK